MMAVSERSTGVSIEKVNKWYAGGVHAVRDMDLTVENGEFMIFAGPSGCGKSTLLRMIAGLESVNGGDIRMGGRVINTVAPKDRDIAMVFQNYALYPTMRVYDNMAFPLKMRHWKRESIRARVTEVAGSLGLTEYLHRRPGALSGGQRQRVALGRAMVRDPRLFLMDEPLSNLDAKLRVDMRREIVELQRRLGTTTIYVTHDQTEAMTMGTRIAVMKDGVLQQADAPRTVYDRPANLFVAKFIGSPPMNTWDGEHEGRACTVGLRPEHISPLPRTRPGPSGAASPPRRTRAGRPSSSWRRRACPASSWRRTPPFPAGRGKRPVFLWPWINSTILTPKRANGYKARRSQRLRLAFPYVRESSSAPMASALRETSSKSTWGL